jgi:hypothetical protein
MMSEHWYEVVPAETSLTQGDLISDCPILNWSRQNPVEVSAPAGVENLRQLITPFVADVVVMTQACDLEHGKVANVVLCPHLSLTGYRTLWENSMKQAGHNPTEKSWRRVCDDIANGYVWNQAFLNRRNEEPTLDIRVVDFHELYTLPRSFLESVSQQRGKERLRLRPPYREHLSQAFARFFMRVGLPTPLDKTW